MGTREGKQGLCGRRPRVGSEEAAGCLVASPLHPRLRYSDVWECRLQTAQTSLSGPEGKYSRSCGLQRLTEAPVNGHGLQLCPNKTLFTRAGGGPDSVRSGGLQVPAAGDAGSARGPGGRVTAAGGEDVPELPRPTPPCLSGAPPAPGPSPLIHSLAVGLTASGRCLKKHSEQGSGFQRRVRPPFASQAGSRSPREHLCCCS